MNMGKLGRRLFAWCLLAVLFPLAANAAPTIELTGVVTSVEGLPAGVIEVEVLEGDPWIVHIDDYTEVDVDLSYSHSQGTPVRIEAAFARAEEGAEEGTEGQIIALEISAGDVGVNEFEGKITIVAAASRDITVIGHKIHVPYSAEINDASGNSIDKFEDLGGLTVRVEGDYYLINEVTEIADFSCSNNSNHVFKAAKSEDATSKSTEHYCLLSSGKRGGLTEISHTDYTGTDVSSYTLGKYNDGDRHGFWLTIDVTGAIIQRCLYDYGMLVDGDFSCPA